MVWLYLPDGGLPFTTDAALRSVHSIEPVENLNSSAESEPAHCSLKPSQVSHWRTLTVAGPASLIHIDNQLARTGAHASSNSLQYTVNTRRLSRARLV